jgi:hypothetical protein
MKMGWVAIAPKLCIPSATDEDRHAEAGRLVERVTSDLGFGPLIGRAPGVETSTDDGPVSMHLGFHQAPPAISGATLPSNGVAERLTKNQTKRRSGLDRRIRMSGLTAVLAVHRPIPGQECLPRSPRTSGSDVGPEPHRTQASSLRDSEAWEFFGGGQHLPCRAPLPQSPHPATSYRPAMPSLPEYKARVFMDQRLT